MSVAVRPLFGRSSELEVLRSLVDRVADGVGRVAVIEGVAGIGKTRLLREVLEYGKGRGLRVLRGAADELERDRPFRVLTRTLDLDAGADDPRRAEIGRLLVGEPGADASTVEQASDLSFRIIDAVADLLQELCIAGPMVLALEDLHWADPSTIRTVRSVARRLAASPIALFVTLRPAPSVPDIEAAVADLVERGARHLILDPLDEHSATSLARDVVSAELGPHLRAQVAGAGGNPLFVTEVLEALREEGAIELGDGLAEVAGLSVPPSLRLTILRRLRFLPDESLGLLKVASILGSSFSIADLSLVTGRSVVQLLSLFTDVFRAGILGETGERVAFRHDLIREAIYEEIPAAIRKDLHREAGRVLTGAGAAPAQVAQQMSLGASPGDAEALFWLRRAAREAGPRSAPVAVRLLKRALELTEVADPDRRAILDELALPLLTVGRLDEAEAYVRESLGLEQDPAAKLPLRRSLATIIFFRGDRPGALDLFESNGRAPEAPEGERSTDLALASMCAMYSGDLAGARNLAAEGKETGDNSGDAFGTSLSLMTLSTVARYEGSLQEALDLGARAVQLASRADTPWAGLFIHPALLYGGACLEGDRLDEAEDVLRMGRNLAERSGTWHIPWYQMYLGARSFLTGDWDDAIAEAQAGLSFLDDMEFTPFAAALFPRGLIAAIALFRGDAEAARFALARAEEELARSGPQVGVDAMLWAKATLLEAEGDPAQARSVLDGVWSSYGRAGYHHAHRWLAPDLVRLTLDAGDADRAGSIVADLEDLATRAGVHTVEGVALRCRGLLENDPRLLVASVEAYRRGPRPFERALACEDAAIAVGRDGRIDEARSLLEEALEVYEKVGATRAIDRAEAGARASGVRRGRRGPRRRPALGWESLTPTELRVVELVAQGLTNRATGEQMFISARTVETHVAHLFAKLQVSNRAALAATAIRHLG